VSELLRCARAFFIRDAQNAVSYRFAFIFGQFTSLVRTATLWLPAQLIGNSPLFEKEGGFLAFSVTGSAMLSFFMASYGGFAASLSTERGLGTLESVFATRAPLSALLLGGSTWTLLRSLLDVGLNLIFASLFFGLHFPGSPLQMLPVLLLTNFTFIGLGFFSAAFTIMFKRGDPFGMLVGGASVLLGGVFYPTDVLPRFVSWIGELLPITHGARALRGIALHGDTAMQHGFEIMVLLGFNAVLVPLGLLAFYKAVARGKLDGTLFQY
jgi:ABC-2 type transport system permease protein